MSVLRTLRPACLAIVLAALTLGCSVTTATAGVANEPGASMRTVTTGQAFTMSPGDSVVLPDRSTLRYVGLKSDSRCRPEVRCVWAGDAEVTFEWTATGAAVQSFELHTGFADKRYRSLASQHLALLSLARGEQPEARLQVDATP